MEPNILDDIREIEKLHRKLQVAGSPYDARKRYAECLRAGLAAWNEGRSCIYTDDVKAAEAFRKDGSKPECLARYDWLVLGDQGYGLFREDGSAASLDMIDFWYQITPELRRAVEAEAYLVATTCAASYGFDPEESDPMRKVLQLHDAEVCEAFCEASSNAREQVEKEAAALPATPPPVTDAPLPVTDAPPPVTAPTPDEAEAAAKGEDLSGKQLIFVKMLLEQWKHYYETKLTMTDEAAAATVDGTPIYTSDKSQATVYNKWKQRLPKELRPPKSKRGGKRSPK